MANDVRPEVTVRRAYQVYLYAVCFVAVFVLLFASALAVYGLVRVAAPDTTGGFSVNVSIGPGEFRTGVGPLRDAERDRGVAQLLQGAIFAALAFAVFRFHWQRSLELRAELERVTAPPPPAPDAPEPSPAPPRRRTQRGTDT